MMKEDLSKMRVSLRISLAVALVLVGASVLGCAPGSVYVGVAVPGPYWGYPYPAPYRGPYTGGWGGYHRPRYPDEDVARDDQQDTSAQASTEAVNDSVATVPTP